MQMRGIVLLGVLLGAFGLAACAPPPPPPPTEVALTITGGADMNSGGRPAQVKVYYLTAQAGFASGDFFALFDSAAATLGADLLSDDQYLLAPGDVKTDAKTFPSPPTHIGVVAAFQNIDQPGWKTIQPLAPNAVNTVKVSVGSATVSVAVSQ